MSEICGVSCACGRNGEMLACGFEKGHKGKHAWATLPTFVEGRLAGDDSYLAGVEAAARWLERAPVSPPDAKGHWRNAASALRMVVVSSGLPERVPVPITDEMKFTTKTGRVLTDADFERLADEAQEGWTEATDAERADALQVALRITTERLTEWKARAMVAEAITAELREGPVPITDEMVERAWNAYWAVDPPPRGSGLMAMRAALDAALNEGER